MRIFQKHFLRGLLGTALITVLALVGIPTSSAAAPPSPTQLTFVDVSETVTIAGLPMRSLSVGLSKADGGSMAGKPVQLLAQEWGTSTWTTVSTAITDTSGQAIFNDARLYGSSNLKFSFAGDATSQPSTSATWFEFVRVQTGISVNDPTPNRGQPVEVTGFTVPVTPGNVVELFSGDACESGVMVVCPPDSATKLAESVVKADGTYTFTIDFSAVGTQQLFSMVMGSGTLGTGWSTDGTKGYSTITVSALAETSLEETYVADLPTPVANKALQLYVPSLQSADGGATGPIKLMVKTYGSSVFRTVRTIQPGTSFTSIVLGHTADIKWVFAGDANYAPSSTSPRTIWVSTQVGARASDLTPAKGQVITFKGFTSPNKAGLKVTLYRGETCRGAYCMPPPVTKLAEGIVKADGTYVLTRKLWAVGNHKLFVEVNAGKGNTTGWSPYLNVAVH